MNMSPPTTLTMCPQCERVAVSSSAANASSSAATATATSTASIAAATTSAGIARQPPAIASNQQPMTTINPWTAIFSKQALPPHDSCRPR